MLEHVVDVGAAGRRVGLVELPLGVGGADQPVPTPRDHEQHALLGAQDQAGVQLQAIARHDEVDALGRGDVELAALADQMLQLVGPDAGRVDHDLGVDLELLTGDVIAHPHAGDPARLAQEAGDRHRVGHRGSVAGRGTSHGQRVARIVDLGVLVLQRPDQRVGRQRRRDPQRAPLGQVAVAAHALVAAQLVVEQHPGADVDALPDAVGQRVQEGDGSHQVGRDHVEQQAALAQRLAHEVELHLLEVAQPAVDQLGGAARGPRGEVPGLHQRHRQAAGGGVQRRAGAGRAAADHEHVEGLGAQPLQGAGALRRIQGREIVGRGGIRGV